MKIIDLLNKIANGEEVPKKIKFRNNIYLLVERNDNVYNYKQLYNDRLIDNYLCDDWFIDSKDILNDEVEIIEEEKKIPEKLKDILKVYDLIPPVDENMYKIWTQVIKNHNKLNEVLDYLKSKGE